tara:strand:+ start:20652 stop:21524 length:873 start_codon:yes stop_codon:yes gene_type:complete
MGNRISFAISTILLSFLVLSYQACSDVSFSEIDSLGSESIQGAEPVNGETPPNDTGSDADSSQDSNANDNNGGGEDGNDQDDSDNADEQTNNDDDNPVVCNPFDPLEPCYNGLGLGLKGKLYYLTEKLFPGDLYKTVLKDYRDYGAVVPANIIMTQVNVPDQSWTNGFILSDGQQVAKADGEELFEWFHLDLHGQILLPPGTYQFASLSDDGFRLTIDGKTIIDHDGIHAPSWKCGSKSVSFKANEPLPIRVEYFQGPRVRIAMQLFYREASSSNCQKNLKIVPSDAFTH